jgi:DNA-binding CsgD family transcriptional regulator
LIDLAPSTSHVLAMQKYFRPMTKWGDEEARIYIIMPSSLPKIPLLPTDFFLYGSGEYQCGELIAPCSRTKSENGADPVKHCPTPVAGVSLKSRIVLSQKFERPKLDPKDHEQIKAVCLSNPAIKMDNICGYQRFRWLYFNHDLFKGHGWQLLRFLRVTGDKNRYLGFMAKMFAEAARNKYMEIVGMTVEEERHIEDVSCYDDAAYFINRVGCKERWEWSETSRQNIELGAGALFGSEIKSTETAAILGYLRRNLLKCLKEIGQPYESVLNLLYGEDLNNAEVARRLGVSRTRVWQIEGKAFRLLRHPSKARLLKEFLEH